ncbi:hypothetical protein [Hymenobacter sp. BT730]|uniref:hypothetical protein n=1 Tax=Hymenobacter sp. BT730 TaxID=3063332 RepID=UPI0026E08059|nr:hypothetical protein [Hymenobacter sp. BT730]
MRLWFTNLLFPHCRQFALLLGVLWAVLSQPLPARATEAAAVRHVLRPYTSPTGTAAGKRLLAAHRLQQEALMPAAAERPSGMGPAWICSSAGWEPLQYLPLASWQQQKAAETIAIRWAWSLLGNIAPNAP